MQTIHRFKSKSRAGVFHIVKQDDDGKVTCTCEGFKFGGRCWHTEGYERKPKFETTQLVRFPEAKPSVRREVRRWLKRHHRQFAYIRDGFYAFDAVKTAKSACEFIGRQFGVRMERASRVISISLK